MKKHLYREAEMISPIVSKTDTVMRKAICPKQRLSLTLQVFFNWREFSFIGVPISDQFLISLMKFAKQL